MTTTVALPVVRAELITPSLDPRVVGGRRQQRDRLAQLSPSQRAHLLLERYPELRSLPRCDWERVSVHVSFSLLFGESSRHFARVELAVLAGVLASNNISWRRAWEIDYHVRKILDDLQERFGIATPKAITSELWEAWGRHAELMRKFVTRINRYSSGVNIYLGHYRDHLSAGDQARVGHLLLPPLPTQFCTRFVPSGEEAAAAQRRRKAQTDVLAQCATAILALMLARQRSMDRFIGWYRAQIARIEAGELVVPARLVYQDQEMDLPREPGPDAINIEELKWRYNPVRLELTIWRPHEFTQARNAALVEAAAHEAQAKPSLRKGRERSRLIEDRGAGLRKTHSFFVEVHLGDAMPWFLRPVSRWYTVLGSGGGNVQADGRHGQSHAGVGTPDRPLSAFLTRLATLDRDRARNPSNDPRFEPESTYRGVLFGTAIVTLMLTSDARINELLQISVDRFVWPARLYMLKNPDGTPKRDPQTKQIVYDLILEQLLLPKGRKSDDLRIPYNVTAAATHLQEITRQLQLAHGGQVPVVPYNRRHPKAEHLGSERYIFQWNGRHLRVDVANSLIRLVLDGVVLTDRAGERIDVRSHLLRHAAMTVQRHTYEVPLAALAEAAGHTLADGEAPEATRYYSQMPESQKAELRQTTVLAMLDDARVALRVLDPDEEARRIERLMEEADEYTRESLERYGALHPVTFGHCGYPGLCVRGTMRSFCIGCPFLVRRPEYIDRVEFFLRSYTSAADEHERMGDLAGARERRRMIRHLRQLGQEMRLLAEAEQQGTWVPLWKQLPASAQM